MRDFYIIESATPKDAPSLIELAPVAPIGMALGKPIQLPQLVVATFTTLTGMTNAGWLGNYFFLAPEYVTLLSAIGETDYLEYQIMLRDIAGKSCDSPVRGVMPLNNVSCLDVAQSDLIRDEQFLDDIIGIRRLALVHDKIPIGRHLFHLAEFPTALVASEALVTLFLQLRIRGIKFR